MAIVHSDESVKALYKALATLDNEEDIERLLFDLCTKREVDELAQRLKVARMLSQGQPYSVIQNETGASAATVARISKFLNQGAGGYRQVLDMEE